MNRVAVLGSTGSIGTQTLAVARGLRSHVEIVALAAGRNAAVLSQQLAEFRPHLYSALSPDSVDSCGATFADLESIAIDDAVDTVVVATTGLAGLAPTLAALRHGKKVALASKEVLVMAGSFVMDAASASGAELVPIDSEHSAIWQCLQGEYDSVKRLLLTASGGPFRDYSADRLARVSADDALAHPVWSMGPKITVDSATLMNKGLEVIEAHWLFGVPFDQIDVVVHPECIVHSMVEFVDCSVKAQMSVPDMTLPIQYALTHPARVASPAPALRWDAPRTLTFRPVNMDRFPCLRLAREAGVAGGACPAVLCGADDASVDLFLRGAIGFADIASMVEDALSCCSRRAPETIDDVVNWYDWARTHVYGKRAELRAGSQI